MVHPLVRASIMKIRVDFFFLEHGFSVSCATLALEMKDKFLKVGCKDEGEVVGRKLAVN